jgi:tetratricopeptide (TPR) repeat protein
LHLAVGVQTGRRAGAAVLATFTTIAGDFVKIMTPSGTCAKVCLIGLALFCWAGCQSQPTTGDASATARALREKSLLALADIPPAIAQPTNPPTTPTDSQATAAIDQAKEKIKAGDSAGAIEILQQALALKPDDFQAQVTLAGLLHEAKQDSQACVHFRTALKCSAASDDNPTTAEVLYNLADLLQNEGYLTAALECYDSLQEHLEKNERSYMTSSLLKELMVRPERLLLRQGQLLVQLGRPAQAVAPLTKAFEGDRGNAVAVSWLMEAMIADKQYAKAEQLVTGLAGDAAQTNLVCPLAEKLCRSAGQPAMPLRIWNAVRNKNIASPALAIALGKVSQKLNQADQGITILQQALTAMPANTTLANTQAGMLARNGKPADALGVLARMIQADQFSAGNLQDGLRQIVRSQSDTKALQESLQKFVAGASKDTSGIRPDVANYLAGMVAQMTSRPQDAQESFSQSIAENDAFLVAYEALLDLQLLARQYPQAQATIDMLAGEDVAYFADYLRGKMSFARGNPTEAIKSLEKVGRDRKDGKAFVPALLLLAESHLQQRQATQAISAINSALQAEPDNLQVYRCRLRTIVAVGRASDAGETIQMMFDKIGDTPEALIVLGEFYVASNQLALAQAVAEQLLAISGDSPEAQLLAARAQLPSGALVSKDQFDRAMGYLDAALKLDGEFVEALALRAQLNGQADRYDQASDDWGRLCKISPRRQYAQSRAGALMMAGKYVQALGVLETLEQFPSADDLPIRKAHVLALTKLGRIDQASEYLEKLIEQNKKEKPRSNFFRAQLLWVYTQANEPKYYALAQKLLADWLASASADLKPSLKREIIQTYCLAKDYDGAFESARKSANRINPDYSQLIMLVGQLRRSQPGRLGQAGAMVDQYLNKPGIPDDAKNALRQLKINILVSQGLADAAERYAQAWIDLNDGDSLVPRKALILALMTNKNSDQALKVVRNYLAQIPPAKAKTRQASSASQSATSAASRPATSRDELRNYLRLTEAMLLASPGQSRQNYQQALDIVTDLMTAGPDRQLLELQANCQGELGMNREMIATMEKLLSLNSDDPMTNNNLAYVYAEFGINLDKAEKMLLQASRQMPNTSMILDSIGWVYYKQGKFGQAGLKFRQILQNEDNNDTQDSPGDAILLDHAGDVYYKLLWKDKALDLWNRALESAKKQSPASRDDQKILQSVPAKIKAVKAGLEPTLPGLAERVLN